MDGELGCSSSCNCGEGENGLVEGVFVGGKEGGEGCVGHEGAPVGDIEVVGGSAGMYGGGEGGRRAG